MNQATVLLVEDDATTLRGLQQILFRHGRVRVETATDGEIGWERAQRLRPDLIVSDYQMPGLTGFDLCKRVKADEHLRGTMFVVLTGFTDTALKVTGLDLGVDDYLTKPVEAPEFLAKIRATLRIKGLHDALRRDKDELHDLHTELARSFDNLLSVLVHLLDLSVPGASARGERLATHALELARLMKVPDQYLEDLNLAARLHEIGRVVQRPGSINASDDDEEPWRYLVLSRAVLEQVERLQGAADLVQGISENWDGTGSPDRLVKGQITMRSRILRVLIDLHRLLHDGTGNGQAITPRQGIQHLSRFSGTRYDPLVLATVETMIGESAPSMWRSLKRRVPIGDLTAGMVLADDLTTASGIKLLSNGATITTATLQLIQRRHLSDPVLYGAWVVGN